MSATTWKTETPSWKDKAFHFFCGLKKKSRSESNVEHNVAIGNGKTAAEAIREFEIKQRLKDDKNPSTRSLLNDSKLDKAGNDLIRQAKAIREEKNKHRGTQDLDEIESDVHIGSNVYKTPEKKQLDATFSNPIVNSEKLKEARKNKEKLTSYEEYDDISTQRHRTDQFTSDTSRNCAEVSLSNMKRKKSYNSESLSSDSDVEFNNFMKSIKEI